MMTNEVKEAVKGKTTEEIKAMIKNKEIVVPANEKDRDEFLLYASKKPEERDVSVSNDDPAKAVPVTPVPPAEDGHKDDKDGSIADDTSGKWWEELGHASAKEAIDSHKKIYALNQQLQTTLDNINAKEGKRGRELKELKEEKDRILKELDELKAKSTPVVKKPTKPVRPNPKDFDEGVLDPGYQEKRDEYTDAMEVYNEQLLAFERQENQKRIDELRTVIPKKEDTEGESTPDGAVSAWKKLYDEDIPAFQKKFGVETTVPIGLISENLNKQNGITTKDAAEMARGKAFIDSVPKRDMEIYAKVRTAVEMAYDFTSKGPVSKYAKGMETAIIDHDMLGEGKAFNIVKPTSLTPEEEKALREKKNKENESTVSPIPGSKLANGDASASSTMTKEEKTKRYKDLMDAYKVACRNGTQAMKDFEASAPYAEFKKLGIDLGYQKAGTFRG
jgi:hypothetical protein